MALVTLVDRLERCLRSNHSPRSTKLNEYKKQGVRIIKVIIGVGERENYDLEVCLLYNWREGHSITVCSEV